MMIRHDYSDEMRRILVSLLLPPPSFFFQYLSFYLDRSPSLSLCLIDTYRDSLFVGEEFP